MGLTLRQHLLDDPSMRHDLPPLKQSDLAALVGAKIRRLRQRQGLTDAELAVLLRLPRRNIAAYEEGKSLPRVYTLYLLSRIFDTEMGSFLDDPMEGGAAELVRLGERVRAIPVRHRRVLLHFLDTLLSTMERLPR